MEITIEQARKCWELPMVELRRRLIIKGIFSDQVSAKIQLITNVTERALALNSWEYATTVHRMSPLVLQLAPLFSMDEKSLDDLFLA